MRAWAIVPAAGEGRRLGAGRAVPKAFVRLGGRTLLDWSLQALVRARAFDGIVVVAPRGWITRAAAAARRSAQSLTVRVAEGGRTRQGSVAAGLAALPPDCRLVAVHDAARPFVPPHVIRAAVSAAARTGASLPGLPVADTLKRADARGRVRSTLPRAGLFRAQTPQVARRAWLEGAHRRARRSRFEGTDEAQLLELAGYPVVLVAGHERNFKITTADDLARARALVHHGRPG